MKVLLTGVTRTSPSAMIMASATYCRAPQEAYMIDAGIIHNALKAPVDKPDTNEQAQLRACLINVISGHNEVDTIRICGDLINLMRDQLSTGAASVRRLAAAKAKEIMSPADIAEASGQTRQTIARLLTEARGI